MNLEKFKLLIKNTVKEAVKEAINESFSETKITPKANSSKVKSIMESMNIETPQVNISSNPILDILNTTAKQMTKEDYKTIGNFNSSDISIPFNPGVGVNTVAEGSSLPSGEVNMDQIMNLLGGK
jgi:hypothetical protein